MYIIITTHDYKYTKWLYIVIACCHVLQPISQVVARVYYIPQRSISTFDAKLGCKCMKKVVTAILISNFLVMNSAMKVQEFFTMLAESNQGRCSQARRLVWKQMTKDGIDHLESNSQVQKNKNE